MIGKVELRERQQRLRCIAGASIGKRCPLPATVRCEVCNQCALEIGRTVSGDYGLEVQVCRQLAADMIAADAEDGLVRGGAEAAPAVDTSWLPPAVGATMNVWCGGKKYSVTRTG